MNTFRAILLSLVLSLGLGTQIQAKDKKVTVWASDTFFGVVMAHNEACKPYQVIVSKGPKPGLHVKGPYMDKRGRRMFFLTDRSVAAKIVIAGDLVTPEEAATAVCGAVTTYLKEKQERQQENDLWLQKS